ncbi:hypothetical protein KO489_00285 [Reinekea forsetii]|nr:hypothetical protein [Reinekea forsetii]
MQQVPIDKILVQPTVQYRWLAQHGWIEFNLPEQLLSSFTKVWQLYRSKNPDSVCEFLNDTEITPFYLQENDVLFSLFTGAQYALSQNSQFQIDINGCKMYWRITD